MSDLNPYQGSVLLFFVNVEDIYKLFNKSFINLLVDDKPISFVYNNSNWFVETINSKMKNTLY